MAAIQINLKDVPAKAWVIISIGIFVLLLGIGYSFLRGWSSVQVTKTTDTEAVNEERPASNE